LNGKKCLNKKGLKKMVANEIISNFTACLIKKEFLI